jgi:hypothetical protein
MLNQRPNDQYHCTIYKTEFSDEKKITSRYFLTSCAPVSFSRRIMLFRISPNICKYFPKRKYGALRRVKAALCILCGAL